MTNTTARIRKEGKDFEIIVNMDNALKFRKGENIAFLEMDTIFLDAKKGNVASKEDLMKAFKTTDINEIAAKIVKSGEVLVTQQHRDAEQEKKFKQIVDFLVTNTVDPKTGNPHTPDRIKSALEQAHVNIKNTPIDSQIAEAMEKVSKILPIKIETRKIKINIPAMHTAKAYGVVNQYKEEESWKDDGSLEVIIRLPAGMLMDFYDKLNSVTHGSALTQEIKQ